jgi:alpha-tubulin suppressor-like RCC1 family protein
MIWAWGRNTYRSLGTNNATDYSSPVAIARVGSYKAVSSGSWLGPSLAIDAATGRLWSWGFNSSGQLGDGTVVPQSSPVLVQCTASFVAIGTGLSTGMAIDSNKNIWAWGRNDKGQLGESTTTNVSIPIIIAKMA